jgi:hypothetical protein
MIFVILFFIELILLFLISRRLSETLFVFVFIITGSSSFALSAVTIMFFPGTVIHELSHLFTAEILGVKTGKLNLVPETISNKKLKNGPMDVTTGSVAIAQSDPFRRALIGLSPLTSGVIILTVLAYFLPGWFQISLNDINHGEYLALPVIRFLLTTYLMFTIYNSMYASKADMKGLLPLAITFIIFIIAAYYAGLRFIPPKVISNSLVQIFTAMDKSLALMLAINLLLLLISILGIAMIGKIFKKRIVF